MFWLLWKLWNSTCILHSWSIYHIFCCSWFKDDSTWEFIFKSNLSEECSAVIQGLIQAKRGRHAAHSFDSCFLFSNLDVWIGWRCGGWLSLYSNEIWVDRWIYFGIFLNDNKILIFTSQVQFVSQLAALRNGFNIIGLLVVLPLLVKVLNLDDVLIAIVATVAFSVRCLIICLSTKKNMLYGILGVALFDNLLTQPLRSTMIKIVGAADSGKVGRWMKTFGFFSSFYL